MQMPSEKEIWEFMSKEAKPYTFEFVKDNQPLRVNIESRKVYVNKEVLMTVIKDLMKAGLDWKEIMRKNLMHEKAHERYYNWNLKWDIPATQYGWLPSYLTDIVIDKIYFKDNTSYQKWLLKDSRLAFEMTKKDIWRLFPTIAERPHFLYNQAAYWIAIGAVDLNKATNLYPEKADYIFELSELLKKIKSEKDLSWAFTKAKSVYLKNFLKL